MAHSISMVARMGRQENKPRFAILMHEILNDVATVLGIAQLSLAANKDLPSDVRAELKQIVDVGLSMADKLKQMAEVLQEDSPE